LTAADRALLALAVLASAVLALALLRAGAPRGFSRAYIGACLPSPGLRRSISNSRNPLTCGSPLTLVVLAAQCFSANVADFGNHPRCLRAGTASRYLIGSHRKRRLEAHGPHV
jgi:hypothetical protein